LHGRQKKKLNLAEPSSYITAFPSSEIFHAFVILQLILLHFSLFLLQPKRCLQKAKMMHQRGEVHLYKEEEEEKKTIFMHEL